LPNFVAGERFGFGAALPTLTTSFLGMAFSSCEALSDGVLFEPTFHHEADRFDSGGIEGAPRALSWHLVATT
jgi:hypothetical protein